MQYAIQRRLKLGIEIRGLLKIYEATPDKQWDISCRFKKTTDATKNKGIITIANLDKETRNYFLQETSPFKEDRQKHRILLEASFTNQEYSRIMTGFITSATTSQAPDIYTTFNVETLGAQSLDVAIINYNSPRNNLSGIARDIAGTLGLSLVFQADDVTVKNWSFSGAKTKLVERLNRIPAIDAYVDDGNLIVKNTGQELRGESNLLTYRNGMIGHPELTEIGCNVRTTLLPTLKIGAGFQLESKTNPSANGSYEIFEMNYNLSSRGDNFYVDVAAKRQGVNNQHLAPLESAITDTQLMQARSGGTEGLQRLLQPTAKPSASTNPTSSIINAIDRRIGDAATQMPAVVINYDRQRNVARVKGLIMRLTSDGGPVPESVIAEVPVLAYGGGGVSMTFPLVPGSLGWIEASQRDISAFMDTLAESPVPTNRTHDWGDSRFIPDAFRQFTLPQNIDGAFCLQSMDGSTFVSLKKGQVNIISDNAVSVKSPDVTVNATNITFNADTLTANVTTYNMNAENFNMTAKGSISGDVDIQGVLTINGVRFNNHYHIESDGSNTSGPRNA